MGAAAFVRWATAHARVLSSLDSETSTEDLAAIDRLAHRARVIAVGESNHNVHEFLRLRQRVLHRLAQRGAIAAIAMEVALPEARRLDAWLVGDSSEAPRFDEVLDHGYGRDAEMRDLLVWLHDHNARVPRERRVHFYGLDMPRDDGGSLLPALEPVWAFLDRVDPAYGRANRARVEPIARAIDGPGFWRSVPLYDSLPAAARDTLRTEAAALAERFATHRKDYLARSTPENFAWAARLAEVVRQTEVFLRDRDTPLNPRDVGMAENLDWVLAPEGRRGSVLLFAHNLHVARAPIEGPMIVARFGHPAQVRTLGQILDRSLGSSYVTIGTAHDLGAEHTETVPADSTSVDGALARVGQSLAQPLFLLDLRDARMPADARAWLARPHLMRAVSTYVVVRPAVAFDALVFVEAIRPAERVPVPTGSRGGRRERLAGGGGE